MKQTPKDAIQVLSERIRKLEQENAAHQAKLEEYKYNNDIQKALNEIMHLSMLPLSFAEIQSRILDVMLNVEWLTLAKKGCMFVVDKPGELKMMAHKNLSESLLTMCNRVPFGNCLCGKAAQEKQLIFKSCLDDDHQYRPSGILPHGHYNAPIKDRDNKVLGVLNLYVKHGHKPTAEEAVFIKSVCNVLAILFEAKKLEDELKRQALTDGLTGLHNRRSLMDSLEQYIYRAQRNNSPFVLLFLDLNKFKPINDTFGHEAGDFVLVESARRLKTIVRKYDVISRIGGDEFIIILENVAAKERTIARIKDELSQPYPYKSVTLKLSVSIGSAIYPNDSQFPEELIKHADKSMYKDKN